MKHCFEYQLDVEQECKIYRSIFKHSDRQVACDLEKYEKLRKINDPHILLPIINNSNDREFKVELLYDDKRALSPTLFNTVFEFSENGKKLRGNYKSVLSIKQRINLALQLCDAFTLLNENEIYIKYPSDDMILFDYARQRIYIDVIPYVLDRYQFNCNHDSDFIEELNFNYHILLGYRKKKSFSKELFDYTDKKRNYIILSYLIHKILSGTDCLKWFTRDSVSERNLKYEDIINEQTDILFGADFFKDAFSLITCDEKGLANNSFFRSPIAWKNIIKQTMFCPCGGIFTYQGDNVVCTECKKSKVGIVECKGSAIPLIIPCEYYPMSFGYEKDTKPLFILNERKIEAIEERALFIPLQREVWDISSQEAPKKIESINERGNYYQFSLNGVKDLKIRIDEYVLEFFFNNAQKESC